MVLVVRRAARSRRRRRSATRRCTSREQKALVEAALRPWSAAIVDSRAAHEARRRTDKGRAHAHRSKVPQLPESVAEATLVGWHKKAGEAVARDENLIDVETDKVVLEVPAPGDGVLVELVKPDGATVTCDEVIAVIDTEGKGAAAAAAAPKATEPKPRRAAAPARRGRGQRRGVCRPRARSMAEQGVDPASVDGTGRGGRVTKGDVLAASRQARRRAPAPPAPAAPGAVGAAVDRAGLARPSSACR